MRSFAWNPLRGRLLGAAWLVVGLVAPSSIAGEGLAKHLPADTVALVSFPDLTTTLRDCQSLPLWKIYEEKSVHDFFAKPMGMLRGAIEQARAQAREGAGLDPGVLLETRFRAFEFALTRLRLSGPGRPPEIGFAATIDAGEDFPKLKTLLDAARAKIPAGEAEAKDEAIGGRTYTVLRAANPEAPIDVVLFWDQAGTAVYLAAGTKGTGLAQDLLTRVSGSTAGPSLAADADYRACASRVGRPESEFRMFVRVAAMIDTGLQALAMVPADELPSFLKPEGIRAAVSVLGLDGLKAIAVASTASGDHSVNESFVLAPGARKGLLALGGEAAVDTKLLARVPTDASSFSVGRLDAGALWDTLFAALKALSPEADAKVREALAKFEDANALNLRKDLVGALGDQYVGYSMPMKNMMAGMGPSDGCLLIPLRDPGAFEKAAKGLTDAITSITTAVVAKEAEYEGTKIRSFSFKPPASAGEENPFAGMGMNPFTMFTPAYAVKGDLLLVALSRPGLQKALRRFSTDLGEGGAANEGFKRFASRVPAGVSSLSYSDPRPTISMMYTMVTSFLPLFAAGQDLPIDVTNLPVADAITKHLFGGVSYAKSDKEGFYSCAFSPWGVDTFFGLGAATVSLVAGWRFSKGEAAKPEVITAPAPGAKGDPLERAKQDMVDLKSGLTVYKLEHGSYPPNLAALLQPSKEYPEGLLVGRKEIPKDPWGNEYRYEAAADGKSFRLRSNGPNGTDDAGAGDDVVGK